MRTNKQKRKQEGKPLYHLRTHSDTIRMFVQVQTCWQHWTFITKIGTRLRNFGLVFKELMSNGEEIKSSGAARIPWEKNYRCAGTKCWYLSVCASSLPKWFLPTHSWSPWHNSSNEADSSCGVNEGMTLEGGSEKSQIKRTSVEVIVTD